MLKPKIRPAQDSEGEAIYKLLKEVGLVPEGLDWSRVYPSWIVAEYKNEIIGCAQVLPGKPLGHIGFLAVTPQYQQFGIGVHLLRAGEHLLASLGCDGFTGLTDHPHILRKLQKLNFVTFGPKVAWIFKRLYRQSEQTHESLQENRP